MLLEQDYKCAICHTGLDESEAHVDHCHDSFKVRGALCRTCNLGLGHFKDEPNVVERALKYLSKWVPQKQNEIQLKNAT